MQYHLSMILALILSTLTCLKIIGALFQVHTCNKSNVGRLREGSAKICMCCLSHSIRYPTLSSLRHQLDSPQSWYYTLCKPPVSNVTCYSTFFCMKWCLRSSSSTSLCDSYIKCEPMTRAMVPQVMDSACGGRKRLPNYSHAEIWEKLASGSDRNWNPTI